MSGATTRASTEAEAIVGLAFTTLSLICMVFCAVMGSVDSAHWYVWFPAALVFDGFWGLVLRASKAAKS